MVHLLNVLTKVHRGKSSPVVLSHSRKWPLDIDDLTISADKKDDCLTGQKMVRLLLATSKILKDHQPLVIASSWGRTSWALFATQLRRSVTKCA